MLGNRADLAREAFNTTTHVRWGPGPWNADGTAKAAERPALPGTSQPVRALPPPGPIQSPVQSAARGFLRRGQPKECSGRPEGKYKPSRGNNNPPVLTHIFWSAKPDCTSVGWTSVPGCPLYVSEFAPSHRSCGLSSHFCCQDASDPPRLHLYFIAAIMKVASMSQSLTLNLVS